MTREEIAALPAGQKLDALIHEHVFGRVVNWRAGCAFTDETGLLGWNPVPKYSSEIRAAWDVVEKLRERFSTISLYCGNGWGLVVSTIYSPCQEREWVGPVNADTACLAICRTALLTVLT